MLYWLLVSLGLTHIRSMYDEEAPKKGNKSKSMKIFKSISMIYLAPIPMYVDKKTSDWSHRCASNDSHYSMLFYRKTFVSSPNESHIFAHVIEKWNVRIGNIYKINLCHLFSTALFHYLHNNFVIQISHWKFSCWNF